ncbi:GLIPR1-like protein 1 [Taenia crassiceps]|uniref:GLIPR1-like protein 1 n=1 Tax=Taenia crassiceps TaxID=6207 RepID=A0ABR4Q1M3_9CEST
MPGLNWPRLASTNLNSHDAAHCEGECNVKQDRVPTMRWRVAVYPTRPNDRVYLRPVFLTLVSSDILTEEERLELVALHNTKRGLVDPPAADMLELPSPALIEYYQNPLNIAYSDEPVRNVTAMATKWWNEGYSFNYEVNSCQEAMCGHYLQMVWGSTMQIGCAVKLCDKCVRIRQVAEWEECFRTLKVNFAVRARMELGATKRLCSARTDLPPNDSIDIASTISTTSASSTIWVEEMVVGFMLIIRLFIQ